MKFHDELNPKLWDKNNEEYTLKEEVKAKLEEIATAFIEYLDIPADAILDKVITGSSASYNYTEFSDLDLHIIVDFDKVHKDCPVVEGYLSAMKSTFNKEHDIFIHGVPVELYAEKKDQGTVHNGLYSLQTGWIDIPNKIEPTDNDAAVEAKYNELKELIDKCETAEVADELLDKIYTMRKAGLADAGEFSTENLAFKKLRNEGVMNKLRQLKKQEVDKQLSLESYNENVTLDIYTKEGDWVDSIPCKNQSNAKKEFKNYKARLNNPNNLIYKIVKNESIKEATYMDKYKLMHDKATELAQDRAKIDFVSKMNPQDLVNYAVKAIKRNDADISDVENMLNKANYTPGQIEDLLDMIRTNLDEAYYRKRNKCASIREEVTVDSYLKMLRDGGHLFDKEDAEYLIQCFNDKKLEVLAEYKDVEKAAQRFLDCCNKYDKVVFKQLFDNGKEIKVIDTDTKEFNKKPLFMQNESINEEIGEFSTVTDFNSPQEFKQALEKYRKEYEVVDQIEGKNLLHLVYDNGKHIATFNNTKLQKYSESVNEDYEWHGPVARVTFDNGDVIETAINGTDEEIKSYYMGKTFNLGSEEDDMHKVVKVEVIRESVEDIHSNFKSMAKRIVRDFKVKGYPKSNKFYMDFAKEAVAGFKKDWGYDVKIATGNGELILTLEDTYQAVIDAQTHKVKFSDLENSNYMFENKKEEREMKHKNEGMWASPFTVKNAKKVAKLLANPITLGELNSEEKQKELWNVIGDDQFWDDVIEEATAEPDCDARPLIISTLEAWIENKENFNDDAYYQAAEDIIAKAIAKFNNNLKKLRESKNIYKPSTILKALDIERNWYKEIGLSGDEKAPQVMFFIIDNDEIKDTKLVDRQDVYTYKPQANEYYLDRLRDTGFDLTDYNLSHVQKMVDSWNEGKKFEDVDSLCDKIDNANSDLQLLIKSLAPAKNPVVESINKCLAEALEEDLNEYQEEINKYVKKVYAAIKAFADKHSLKLDKEQTNKHGMLTKVVFKNGDEVIEAEFPTQDIRYHITLLTYKNGKEEKNLNGTLTDIRKGLKKLEQQLLSESIQEEIWGVEMFLDTVDGDPEPGHVEFTRDSLIDFLNDYGYELSKDASDEEIKECAEDYEMTIKYIRKPN